MVRSEHAMAHRLLRLVPNSMSLGSLVVGVMSIVLMETQDFLLAGMLIWLGSALDVLDGGLAGRLNIRTAFGKQLDNLADVVTFGIAPALLAYHLL
ncbi:MAG: CDP-alcohol phosphatidyltransferase family protein, partial [Chloroflexi bacterium]|nr:CDP-alcohol phosphatidyltransferase family protein [Chloroflexota bacterium]